MQPHLVEQTGIYNHTKIKLSTNSRRGCYTQCLADLKGRAGLLLRKSTQERGTGQKESLAVMKKRGMGVSSGCKAG